MAIRVVLVDYYKVMVGDRPGEGVRVLSALSSAGINLRAVHAFPAGNGRTQLDLVPVSFRRFETARPEAPGVDRLLAGIAMRHKEDEARLRDGGEVFESLYEYFKRKRR